jgi:iron complex transport system ATP-binding protein
MESNVLRVCGLNTGYRDPGRPPVVLARELEAELGGGELVCLLGPNGAGKSTLLNTLSGALRPLSGRVLLGEDDVHSLPASARARRIGVVLTDRIATGLLTSYQVVCLGRHPYTDWLGRLSPRDHEVAEWALQATGALDLKERFLVELSDGERQRVLVARALAQEPEVLLLDEVTAFVDLPHRVQLMRLLRAVARHSGTAVLLSTHDLDLALRTADRLWVLTRDSGLVEGGPEDLVLSGAFEAAFHREDIEFDRGSGSFRMHAGSGPPVAVVGEGVEAVWTRRAIERAGLSIGPSAREIAVVAERGRTFWRSRKEGDDTTYESLTDLVKGLSELQVGENASAACASGASPSRQMGTLRRHLPTTEVGPRGTDASKDGAS